MSTEKMRKLFQNWANTHYLLSELNWAIKDDEYEEPEMQYAWEAWQASRAAIEVDLPSHVCEEEFDDYSMTVGYNLAIDSCANAVESLGLKVKP